MEIFIALCHNAFILHQTKYLSPPNSKRGEITIKNPITKVNDKKSSYAVYEIFPLWMNVLQILSADNMNDNNYDNHEVVIIDKTSSICTQKEYFIALYNIFEEFINRRKLSFI